MYKIDLVRRSGASASCKIRTVRLLTLPQRCVSLTEVSAVVCELGESSGGLWYRHQGAQAVRGVRLLQEWQGAEID